MASAQTITVHRRVLSALDVLSPEERGLFDEAVRSPERFEALAEEGTNSTKLENGDSLYLFRLSPSLRLVFRREPQGIEIVDLVERDLLKWFSSPQQV